MANDVILDCYTDEPSGLGVPPYLGVHQRYLAGSLAILGRSYSYLTIDDLRSSLGFPGRSAKQIINRTSNTDRTLDLLSAASAIHVVAGAFVDYAYVSAQPPRIQELCGLISRFSAPKTLYYALAAVGCVPEGAVPPGVFREVVTGWPYNYLLRGESASFEANYDCLREVALRSAPLLEQLARPAMVELETGSGCRRKPGCAFCIEHHRGLPPTFRPWGDLVAEARALAQSGAVYFRLGRQPSFYSYMNSDPNSVERLLAGIREACPSLRVLHIDNADPSEVATAQGREISRHIVKYCTDGNIAPFGVESFDSAVRGANNLNGTLDQVWAAIEQLNELGSIRGGSGLPQLLPGLNLIVGLEGETPETLGINLAALERILSRGLLVRRLFIRRLTATTGVTLGRCEPGRGDTVAQWSRAIRPTFDEPMLRRVVPVGTVLRDARVEIHVGTDSLLRQMATCPVRILVRGRRLPIDKFVDIEVSGYEDHRTVVGEPA